LGGIKQDDTTPAVEQSANTDVAPLDTTKRTTRKKRGIFDKFKGQ